MKDNQPNAHFVCFLRKQQKEYEYKRTILEIFTNHYNHRAGYNPVPTDYSLSGRFIGCTDHLYPGQKADDTSDRQTEMKRSVAATLITTEAILFFLVPLALAVWLLVSKLQDINLDPQSIIAPIESAANIIKEKPVTMYWARIPLPLLSPHFLP